MIIVDTEKDFFNHLAYFNLIYPQIISLNSVTLVTHPNLILNEIDFRAS